MAKKAAFLIDPVHFDNVFGALVDPIKTRVPTVLPPLTPSSWRDLPAADRDIEILFAGWGMPRVTEEFLTFLPNLKIILYAAGSIRCFASDAMWERGIRISTAANANAESVAEFTLAQIILGLKAAASVGHAYKTQTAPISLPWMAGNFRSVVGLISLGLIGRRVAEHLRSLSHRVIAYDPYVSAEQARSLGIELVSLPELFAASDVVSCHTPLLDSTRGMLTQDHFESMKPGAVFINTSRGAVVDEAALISVLIDRPDLSAYLDVTVEEPLPPHSPLRRLPNAHLTPHIAGCVGPECRRMGEAMVEELDAYLRGAPLQWELTRERAELLA